MTKTIKLGMIALFSLGVAAALPQQESYMAGFNAMKLAGKTYNGKFYSDYTSLAEVVDAGEKLNQTINDESMTLLKNENNTLPFKNVKKISVFGKSSANPQLSGSGSGASGGSTTDLYTSLEDAGYTLNPVLKNFYEDNSLSGPGPSVASFFGGGGEITIGETAQSSYPEYVKSSYNAYKDAAVILLKRSGSEGSDNPRRVGDFATDSDEVKNAHHYFELSVNETALIKAVEDAGFSKIVLLVNSPSPLELGAIEKDEKIQSIIWTGLPGGNGMKAVGRILNGSVNPSGHTVDTWASDYRKDPTWNNFGDGSQTSADMKTSNYTLLNPDGKNISRRYDESGEDIQGTDARGQGLAVTDTFVRYEEGIYTGYRYYETMGHDEGETWYKNNVVYPFGYGLSYTNFTYTFANATTELKEDGTFSVDVTVKNNGKVGGKDVVEAYFKAPYINGEIEKAYENLAAYAKTDYLEPGESQTLTLSFYLQDMASYDADDANKNRHKGYELDAGQYHISINSDSHTVLKDYSYTIDTGWTYAIDRLTENTVVNAFQGANASLPSKDGMFTSMTRASANHMVQPDAPTKEETKVDTKMLKKLINVFKAYQLDDKSTWYKTVYGEEDPRAISDTDKAKFTKKTWYQQDEAATDATREKLFKSFRELSKMTYDDADWEKVLNNLKYSEMLSLMQRGGWSTTSCNWIGKDTATDRDGPAGLGSIGWAVEVNIAATFNDELSYEFGKINGEESLWRDIPGWYAPAMDAHRSVFGGRNFEYYSEDPLLAGHMGAETILGAQEKGAHVYLKHYALNDQETSRNDICTFASEQAIREVYLKPFQIAVQNGKPYGIMGGMNRIGLVENYANYGLMTQTIRNEWGFEGCIETDANFANDTRATTNNPIAMYCSGTNLNLGNLTNNADYGVYDKTTNKVTITDNGTPHDAYSFWYHVRQNAKAVLYETSHSSEADNGHDFSSLTSTSLTFYANVAGSDSVAADLTKVGSDNATYSLASGSTLPTGLSLASNGTISGTATEVGTYTVNVEMHVDGWISKTIPVTIKVESPIVATGSTNLTLNTAMSEIALNCLSSTTKVGDKVTVRAGWSNTYQVPVTGFTFGLARGSFLPAGLTLSKDGKITGTPTVAGTFTVNVTYSATYDANPSLGVSAGSVALATAPLTITVTDPNATKPTDEKTNAELQEEIEALEKEIADLKAAVEAGKDDSELSAKITALETRIAALEGKTPTDYSSQISTLESEIADLKTKVTALENKDSGGCGGSIAVASTAVGALALFGVALAFKKKREEK